MFLPLDPHLRLVVIIFFQHCVPVHFRAMAVYPNLKPYLGKLDIELTVSTIFSVLFKGELNA